MILNRYERMVAKRYLLPGKGEGFIFLVAGISLMAVALGVAALIIVMSVMNGFRGELFDKIVGLNGHAVVNGYEGRLANWQQIASPDDAPTRPTIRLHTASGWEPDDDAVPPAIADVRGVLHQEFDVLDCVCGPERPDITTK